MKPSRINLNDIGVLLRKSTNRNTTPQTKTLFSPMQNKSVMQPFDFNQSTSPIKFSPPLCKPGQVTSNGKKTAPPIKLVNARNRGVDNRFSNLFKDPQKKTNAIVLKANHEKQTVAVDESLTMDGKTAGATNDVLNASSDKKSREENILSFSFENNTQGQADRQQTTVDKNHHFKMKVNNSKKQQMTNSIVSPRPPQTMGHRQIKKHPTAAVTDQSNMHDIPIVYQTEQNVCSRQPKEPSVRSTKTNDHQLLLSPQHGCASHRLRNMNGAENPLEPGIGRNQSDATKEFMEIAIGNNKVMNQTHVGKWLASEIKQKMNKKKLLHIVDDTHSKIPKTKILYLPHELREIKQDKQFMRRNKSNLDVKLMKSESKEFIQKIIKDREFRRNDYEDPNTARDMEQERLQEKLKLMQLEQLPKVLEEVQYKMHSERGVKMMQRVHVLPEAQDQESKEELVTKAVFSKLQPVAGYTSTCENTYRDVIEERKITRQIAALSSELKSPKSLVQKKKKQKMIDEIKQRAADQRFQRPDLAQAETQVPVVPINCQISPAVMGPSQTDRSHQVNQKLINSQMTSDFLNTMKIEEIEPWNIPPQSSYDTFEQVVSATSLETDTVYKPLATKDFNRNLDSLIKKATRIDNQIQASIQQKYHKNIKLAKQKSQGKHQNDENVNSTLQCLINQQSSLSNQSNGFFSARMREPDMMNFNVDSKEAQMFLQSLQYSSRAGSDTGSMPLNSRPKFTRISSKSREILPIASEQFELQQNDIKPLTRQGISTRTGDSVAEVLKKRKNQKLMQVRSQPNFRLHQGASPAKKLSSQ